MWGGAAHPPSRQEYDSAGGSREGSVHENLKRICSRHVGVKFSRGGGARSPSRDGRIRREDLGGKMQRNGSAKIMRGGEDLEEHAYKKCAQGTRGRVRTEGLRYRLASVTTSPPSLSFQFYNAEVFRFCSDCVFSQTKVSFPGQKCLFPDVVTESQEVSFPGRPPI